MAFAGLAVSLGGVYLAGGLRWLRYFAFPFVFFLVAVPWPTKFEQAVIQGLMRAVSSINVEVLNAIGISAVQMGNVIEIGSGFVGIDEACTGVRSLQATFMVSLFLGEFYNFSVIRRIILVIAGALLAFGCNLVRTFFLVYIAEQQGTQAIKGWHDPAGLTILMACLFGLWGVSMIMGGASQPVIPCDGTGNAPCVPPTAHAAHLLAHADGRR
jgi:exosortase